MTSWPAAAVALHLKWSKIDFRWNHEIRGIHHQLGQSVDLRPNKCEESNKKRIPFDREIIFYKKNTIANGQRGNCPDKRFEAKHCCSLSSFTVRHECRRAAAKVVVKLRKTPNLRAIIYMKSCTCSHIVGAHYTRNRVYARILFVQRFIFSQQTEADNANYALSQCMENVHGKMQHIVGQNKKW